jgi:hypothetical protein
MKWEKTKKPFPGLKPPLIPIVPSLPKNNDEILHTKRMHLCNLKSLLPANKVLKNCH